MRVRLSGSTITAHGDNLSAPYVEFPGNEPLGFSTDWTVSGSAPHRKLLDPHGHEYSVELPTQTAPAPGGGSGVTVDNGVDAPAAVTTLVVPGADVSTPGSATLPISWSLRSGTVSWDDPDIATGVVLFALAIGEVVLDVWVEINEQFDGADNHLAITHSLAGAFFWNDPLIGPPVTADTDTGSGVVSQFRLISNASGSTALAASADGAISAILRNVPSRITANGNMIALLYDATGIASGQATVYAMVATPAS